MKTVAKFFALSLLLSQFLFMVFAVFSGVGIERPEGLTAWFIYLGESALIGAFIFVFWFVAQVCISFAGVWVGQYVYDRIYRSPVR